MKNYDEIWLFDQVHSNSEPVHDGMLARVQNDGEFSGTFPVTNGVMQGCVLAPTLFSMMFSAMLTDAFQDGDNGIPIRYGFDGKLFNIRRLQAISKVQKEVLDESSLLMTWQRVVQQKRKCKKNVDQVSDSYDLTISIRKTGGLSTSTWQALQGAHH